MKAISITITGDDLAAGVALGTEANRGCAVNTAAEVIAGTAPWSCEAADLLDWLPTLADDSIDLLITSPPYLAARTYGRTDVARGLDAWVVWMLDVVKAAAPKVKGLIAINCEGQTRNYRYQPAPFLLVADLHRAGFNLRKPCVYERDGIPGSGGPDWLKNRWEPIVCVTRPGRLPWSNNTACGRPPICEPGGRVSHRGVSGARRTFTVQTRREMDGGRQVATEADIGRAVPDVANPGNIIDCGADTHFGFGNESEAPFPLKLAAFFVLSFCPPGGVVCDPYSGSGTSCHAAVENGRRFVGCDVRQSQVDLCARRMRTITPTLFSEAT